MRLRGRVEQAIIDALSPKRPDDPRHGRSVALLARPVFGVRDLPTPAQRASLARALGSLCAKGFVEQEKRRGKAWHWRLTDHAWRAAEKERQRRAGEARRQSGARRREREEEAARARAAYEEAARRARAAHEDAASAGSRGRRPDISKLRKLAALALSSPELHEREAARLKVEQEMKRQRLTWDDLL